MAIALACGLAVGAAGAGLRGLDQATRPTPADPDFLAWEACAEYIPRWLIPYMRSCVDELRAGMGRDVAANGSRPASPLPLFCGTPAL